MLKRLAGCVRQYKGASLLSPLFVVLEVVREVIIPLLMAKLIDDGIDGANQAAILKTGGILAVCCILSLLFGILAGHLQQRLCWVRQEYPALTYSIRYRAFPSLTLTAFLRPVW